jgi:hypothetical protein
MRRSIVNNNEKTSRSLAALRRLSGKYLLEQRRMHAAARDALQWNNANYPSH